MRWLTPSSEASERFNRKPFGFSHKLAGHPLFERERLVALGSSILEKGNPKNFSHFHGSRIDKGTNLTTRRAHDRVAEAIARVDELGSWVKLTSTNEVDREYDNLLSELLADFEELAGVAFRHEISWRSATIFIAAPRTFTPYHIDHTPSFLMQISGEKEVNLFDQDDRSVLTEDEIERFYGGDDCAAIYRDEVQKNAYVFPLSPGLGVHHPRLAPHWVRNGAQSSVALSIGFCMRSLDLQARVYQVNHYLRRLGLHPSPYGRRPLRDRAKMMALGLVSTDEPRDYRETICSGVDRIRAARKFAERMFSKRPAWAW